MAAPVYSTRFLAGHGVTSGSSYVVPVGMVAVVRDLDGYGNMGLGDTARLYLQGHLGQAVAFLDWPSNSESHQEWRGRVVYLAGESVTVNILGGSPIDYYVGGYLLTAT
jgi:hypothetical protein